jgi:hypothetical protein
MCNLIFLVKPGNKTRHKKFMASPPGQTKGKSMSQNPAYDPRSGQGNGQNANDPQFRADQQYAREVRERANQPLNYNEVKYVSPQTPAPQYTQAPAPVNYQTPLQSQPVQYSVSSAPATVARTEVNTFDAPRLRDRVRWSSILAGLFAALATLMVLSLLGVAIGLTAASGDPNGGVAGAAGKAGNYGIGAAIWAAIAALISFFIGGYVAARTAGIRGKTNGWINGALVWAITLPLLLWLASSGASGFLNAIGFNLQGFTNSLSSAVNSTGANPVNTDPAAVQQATETARNGAWGALIALLLGLAAASLGGWLGGRDHNDRLNENDDSRQGGARNLGAR